MAIKAVKLKIRIKLDGKRVYADPVYEVKGRLKPLWARVGPKPGKPEYHPEGVYALRYGTKWEFVGQSTDVVMATKKRLEEELEDAADTPAPVIAPPIINQSGPTILDALEAYLADCSVADKKSGRKALAPKSISGIRGIVEAFQRTCGKTYMREVNGTDITDYFAMLRTQANLDPKDPQYDEKWRKRNVTVKNHYGTLRTFFSRAARIDVKAMLDWKDVPRAQGRTPEAYSVAEMNKMWSVATSEELIRLKFFLATGWRRGEVAHLRWENLDLEAGIAHVRPVGEWKPKTKQEREVSLTSELVKLLKERPRTNEWVFPASRGGAAEKNQLLVMLKDVAKRAGVTGRVDIHKFRSTYAIMLRNSGEVSMEEISGRLGHADPKTTQSYLDKAMQDRERARVQNDKVFGKLA